MSSSLLQIRDVSKTYENQENPVLSGVSLDMKPGDSLAVVGPSGAGKSTLLHIIGTLDQPDSGEVLINGRNPFDLSEPDLAKFRNDVVGFVFQDHHLLPQYSVLENVLLPVLAFGKLEKADEERAAGLLEEVGLSHRLTHRPAELSGGERQRAAIARALIKQPALLLCDEPTGNLDGATAQNAADLLMRLHQAAESVLVVVTHSETLADRMDRRLVLSGGNLDEKTDA